MIPSFFAHGLPIILTPITTNDCVSTISWKTLAYHGPNRTGVQDFALGIDAARFDLGAWIDALSVKAGGLRRTFVVCLALVCNCKTKRKIKIDS